MSNEYNVGDSVWWAKAETKQVNVQCPVCFGKMVVTVILGNGERVETECGYCGRGYEPSSGFLKEYQWTPGVVQIQIERKEVNETSEGREVEYRWGSYILRDGDIFSTEAEANARIQEKIAEHELGEEKKLENGKEHATKSFAWHVGYHRAELKRAERLVEYHSKKVISMRRHAKTPPTNQQEPTR